MSDEKKKPLPPDISAKLIELVKELEAREGLEQHRGLDRSQGGEIELKINQDEALWYVAYKTTSI